MKDSEEIQKIKVKLLNYEDRMKRRDLIADLIMLSAVIILGGYIIALWTQ